MGKTIKNKSTCFLFSSIFSFQESRLTDYNDNPRLNHRTHASIPIDSNIGRYKMHTKPHQYRLLADDLVSRHYPADSTLNILSSNKKSRRSTNPSTDDSLEYVDPMISMRIFVFFN